MAKRYYPCFAAEGAAGGDGGAAPAAQESTADVQSSAAPEGTETGKAAEEAKASFEDLLKDDAYKGAFEKAIEDAKAALLKEQDEAAKQAKMNPDEKLQAALDKVSSLEKENAAILLKNQTAALLNEKSLPEEFMEFLVGQDEKATAARVDMFEKAYTAAVAAAAKDLVPGHTPKVGADAEDAMTAAMRKGAGLE